MVLSGLGKILGSSDTVESTCTFCPGVWRICGPVESPERRPSKIFVICTGWISAAWASGMSLIVLCCCIVRGDVTGQVCLCILENRR